MTKCSVTNIQQRTRLVWLLDTMIEQLNASPPESALGGIKQYENEAAELIESTGLADEVGIPVELKPVIQRTIVEYDTDGLDEFARLIEELGNCEKVELPKEGFPTCIGFRYVTTDCHICASRFDWFAASGLGSEPLQELPPGYKRVAPPPDHPLAGLVSKEPKHQEPDDRYIKGLVACLMGWRALAKKPRQLVETKHSLNDSEQCIVQALNELSKRMTTDPLLKKALGKSNSHGKSILSSLVKREIIDSKNDAYGKGYGLPSWSGP